MKNRREFILQSAALGALGLNATQRIAAQERSVSASKPLRMLLLGATNYLGPHFIQTAMERGHSLSVFIYRPNKEKDIAALPTAVEALLGDRNGDLESIKGRDWDAVLDLATYKPNWVQSLGEALQRRVGHYTFISTMGLYREWFEDPLGKQVIDERSPVLDYTGAEFPIHYIYGGQKVLCEREAEAQFPRRTLILRPSYIAGPRSGNGSGNRGDTLAYWPARMAKGGEVMVAGEPSTPVQFIDVRDLAAGAIRMVENRTTGRYNMIGPQSPATLAELVSTARAVAKSSCTLTWVSSNWLASQYDRQMWSRLLFWTYESEGFAPGARVSNKRALAKGLTPRPLRATLADTFDWYRQQPADWQEKFNLAHRKNKDGTAFEDVPISWKNYLTREQEVLAAWHSRA